MSSKTLTIILLVAQCFLVAAFLIRSDKRLSDFPALYSTARAWQKGEQPYHFENQCKEQEQFQRPACLPFVHPPVLLPLQSVLTTQNYIISYWLWVAALIAVLLICLIPLRELSGDLAASIQALLWPPVVASMWMGQDGVFVLASIIFWVWLLSKDRDFLAGLALSLTVIKPHFAIALAVPLLFARRRAFFGFVVGAAALTLYSFLLIGAEGFRGIIRMTGIMAGETYGLWREGMSNLAGIFALVGIDAPFVVWAIFLVGIGALCFYWHRYGVNLRTISVALVVVLFTAPHAHPWDTPPLVIPLVVLGMKPLLISSLLLYALWPYRLMNIGCYAVMAYIAMAERFKRGTYRVKLHNPTNP